MQDHEREAYLEKISPEFYLQKILKDRTFKMSEMLVSWMYVITDDQG
jgi:hypothetical protein